MTDHAGTHVTCIYVTMQGFEPYVLVSKTKVPWYDERFTGYLENKILHTQTMVYSGFDFAVHPDAFLVHYPHSKSEHETLVKSTGLQHEVTVVCVCCSEMVPAVISEWHFKVTVNVC